jgi:hypothetical protein
MQVSKQLFKGNPILICQNARLHTVVHIMESNILACLKKLLTLQSILRNNTDVTETLIYILFVSHVPMISYNVLTNKYLFHQVSSISDVNANNLNDCHESKNCNDDYLVQSTQS